MRRFFLALVLLVALASSCADRDVANPVRPADVTVDLPAPAGDARVVFARDGEALRATWPAGDGRTAEIAFALGGGPLFASLAISDGAGAPRVVVRGLSPRFEVVTGSRSGAGPYVFFDSPADRPSTRARAELSLASVRAEASLDRGSVTFSRLSAGPFQGELRVRLYAGSPLVHLEAELTQPDTGVAFFYDAGLEGPVERIAVIPSPDDDAVERRLAAGERAPLTVRYRTIAAEWDAGSIALFPPPHAYFFPRDYSTNLGFCEAGVGSVGIRQAPSGGGRFSPWFDAPAGSAQHLDLFLLLDPGRAEAAFARVRAFTHQDAFAPMPGRVTFTSHWHARLTANEEAGTPNAPEVVHVLKRLGVNIAHLAEFHFDAHWDDSGTPRLEDQRILFDLVRRHSDDQLLLLPSEEGVMHVGNPAPGDENGHFMMLFPKPVYFTWNREPAAPFAESLAPYGTVYRLGSKSDALALLTAEHALAWTAHPRIKASAHAPDAYKNEPFYTSPGWLGATWKAMPGDLSLPRLGDRSLRLMDDMRAWGQKKQVLGEVDVFEVDRGHELYAHMNANYLRMARVPGVDDWSGVLEVLRRGDFFTTTGEVLLHDVAWDDAGVRTDIAWTLPLDRIEVVWSRAGVVGRAVFSVAGATEPGRRLVTLPVDLRGAEWVRLEAWDVARDGAFTQQLSR